MPVKNKHKQFEDHTVQSWPEILDDLHIESIPTDYVKQIKVTFIDGKVWLIDVNESYSNYDDLDLALEELYAQHEDVIETINFNIDIEKIKADIEKRTTIFLKKRK
jgi:hypothetical protein